jgi:hypothetical protein
MGVKSRKKNEVASEMELLEAVLDARIARLVEGHKPDALFRIYSQLLNEGRKEEDVQNLIRWAYVQIMMGNFGIPGNLSIEDEHIIVTDLVLDRAKGDQA